MVWGNARWRSWWGEGGGSGSNGVKVNVGDDGGGSDGGDGGGGDGGGGEGGGGDGGGGSGGGDGGGGGSKLSMRIDKIVLLLLTYMMLPTMFISYTAIGTVMVSIFL
eukprot:Sspe_Gene.25899::Locus_10522_Transcript_9_10_Confidence_0.177_Length_375::g.25899::m.25899